MAALSKNQLQDHLIAKFAVQTSRITIDEVFRPGKLTISVTPKKDLECTGEDLLRDVEEESRKHIQGNILSEMVLLPAQ